MRWNDAIEEIIVVIITIITIIIIIIIIKGIFACKGKVVPYFNYVTP